MDLAQFFSTVAGGGVFGSLLSIASSWSDFFKKKQESKLEMEKMRLASELNEKSEAWKAFGLSQAAAAPVAPFAMTLPANAGTVATWIYLLAYFLGQLVSAFREFTRPGLTWGTMGFVVYVYATAMQSERAALQPEITFGAFTAFFWWFGERFTKRTAK